jgi:hypothetical protein
MLTLHQTAIPLFYISIVWPVTRGAYTITPRTIAYRRLLSVTAIIKYVITVGSLS